MNSEFNLPLHRLSSLKIKIKTKDMKEIKNYDILNKLLFQETISALIEGIRMGIQGNGKASEEQLSPSKKHYIYGLVRLSKLLQCSVTTAQRIKSSGILNEAILQPQNHRIMIMDANLALELKKRIDGKKAFNTKATNP